MLPVELQTDLVTSDTDDHVCTATQCILRHRLWLQLNLLEINERSTEGVPVTNRGFRPSSDDSPYMASCNHAVGASLLATPAVGSHPWVGYTAAGHTVCVEATQ
jgi:hypothetical protein